MKTLLGFFFLLLSGFFMGGLTIQNSIIGNSILKIIGVVCIVGFYKTLPKNNNLYWSNTFFCKNVLLSFRKEINEFSTKLIETDH